MKLNVNSKNETILYAAGELKKYLKMMLPDAHTSIGFFSDGICVGSFDELHITCDVADNADDDIIYIKTQGERGFVSGSNPRSVLFAVYEYLRQQGCRWLFPGVDGEYIPVVSELRDVCFLHKHPFKLRGQCIEGAVSHQNVLAAIDFAPKIGLNSFMLECYSPYGYYNAWYSHKRSDTKEDEGLSVQTALQWKRYCEAEIEKRGLYYHDMGHGWTTLAFEMNPDTNEVKAENIQYLAEIRGKRGLYKGSAIDTNFCMSNREGKRRFVNYVADYAQNHDNVDFLHLWLADGRNNHCECSECLKYTPAELYVRLLNDLDGEFTSRGIDTKIVFICYSDLLWAPVKEKIENTDRFLLLFAPFTRDYLTNYGVEADMSALKEYNRNGTERPFTMEGNLAYLEKWREKFHGDVFCYEYHFQSVCFKDFSGIWTAKCAFDDARGIKKNGICGIIEDQSQRNSFPTGFAIYTWAKAMSDEKISFDEIVSDYFSHAFGNEWKKAYDYLCQAGNAFPKEYMLGCFAKGDNLINPQIQSNMIRIKKIAGEFKSVCDANRKIGVRCQAVSWQLLRFHCDMCMMLADVFYALSSGNQEGTKTKLHELNLFLSEKEDFYQNYFDMALFKITIELCLNRGEAYLMRANQ